LDQPVRLHGIDEGKRGEDLRVGFGRGPDGSLTKLKKPRKFRTGTLANFGGQSRDDEVSVHFETLSASIYHKIQF